MINPKKGAGLKQSKCFFNKVSKNTVWEWLDCQSKKFPFVTLRNHEIQDTHFNCNFNCKYQTTISDPDDPTYTLIFDSVNTSDRPKYITVDVNDTNLEKITIQSNFKHYQNHDFHKLTHEINKSTQNIKMIPGYQPYCRTKVNSLKNGCVFFLKEGLTFIEIKDLNR